MPTRRKPRTPTSELAQAVRAFECQHVAEVLEQYHWHIPRAAQALGIARHNLYRKMKQLGILKGR